MCVGVNEVRRQDKGLIEFSLSRDLTFKTLLRILMDNKSSASVSYSTYSLFFLFGFTVDPKIRVILIPELKLRRSRKYVD